MLISEFLNFVHKTALTVYNLFRLFFKKDITQKDEILLYIYMDINSVLYRAVVFNL